MKRSTRGFTLVELLVVMAIISILASIVVPNVINYIRQSRAVRARADIASLESALVKIIADSGRSNLSQIFDPIGVRQELGIPANDPTSPLTSAQLNAAKDIYTRVIYTVLRDGRGALTTEAGPLNDGVVRRLGTSYIDIGFDPWGNLYNIYPGPWPVSNGPVPFRKYRSESSTSATNATLPGSGDRQDALTFNLFDPVSETTGPVSFPASRDKVAFIWSNGENLVSGQAVYNNNGYGIIDLDADKSIFYDLATNGDLTLVGGGDDVNNWDNASSWSPFY